MAPPFARPACARGGLIGGEEVGTQSMRPVITPPIRPCRFARFPAGTVKPRQGHASRPSERTRLSTPMSSARRTKRGRAPEQPTTIWAPPAMPAGAQIKEEEAPPAMPAGAQIKEEEAPPAMPAGAQIKEEEAPPAMPAGAQIKEAPPAMPAGAVEGAAKNPWVVEAQQRPPWWLDCSLDGVELGPDGQRVYIGPYDKIRGPMCHSFNKRGTLCGFELADLDQRNRGMVKRLRSRVIRGRGDARSVVGGRCFCILDTSGALSRRADRSLVNPAANAQLNALCSHGYVACQSLRVLPCCERSIAIEGHTRPQGPLGPLRFTSHAGQCRYEAGVSVVGEQGAAAIAAQAALQGRRGSFEY